MRLEEGQRVWLESRSEGEVGKRSVGKVRKRSEGEAGKKVRG